MRHKANSNKIYKTFQSFQANEINESTSWFRINDTDETKNYNVRDPQFSITRNQVL